MRSYNIHEAKTQLSRLVQEASEGRGFIIAKAGKPLVKVLPLESGEAGSSRRIGFLAGRMRVPDDFDRWAAAEIQELFEGEQD